MTKDLWLGAMSRWSLTLSLMPFLMCLAKRFLKAELTDSLCDTNSKWTIPWTINIALNLNSFIHTFLRVMGDFWVPIGALPIWFWVIFDHPWFIFSYDTESCTEETNFESYLTFRWRYTQDSFWSSIDTRLVLLQFLKTQFTYMYIFVLGVNWQLTLLEG